METLDENTSFGKGHIFTFGQKELVVTKRHAFSSSEIARIRYSAIRSIQYQGYSGKNFLAFLIAILDVIFFQFLTPWMTRTYLEINYTVGEDEANGGYNTRLSKKEVDEIQALLKQFQSNHPQQNQ